MCGCPDFLFVLPACKMTFRIYYYTDSVNTINDLIASFNLKLLFY